jgi:hypothetical protein
VTDASVLQGLGEEFGSIGRSIVGHDPLDLDAQAFVPGQRPLQEGGGVFAPEAGQDLGVGQPGRIIDGDVQVLEAYAPRAMMTFVLAGDAMADAVDLA